MPDFDTLINVKLELEEGKLVAYQTRLSREECADELDIMMAMYKVDRNKAITQYISILQDFYKQMREKK